MEHYAGMDVSMECSSVRVVNASGKIVREAEIPTQRDPPCALLARQRCRVHRFPHPTFVTMANAPLKGAGWHEIGR
jgi:hypothetical protein